MIEIHSSMLGTRSTEPNPKCMPSSLYQIAGALVALVSILVRSEDDNVKLRCENTANFDAGFKDE